MELDKWQQQVLDTEGNLCLCSPRQMGKSTIISMKAGDDALRKPNQSIMVIASVERQALLLFEKILSYIYLKNKKMIKKGKDKPTKHELKLINGSIIRCLPTGDTGYGIRGYTINTLYADEAAFIKEDVWAAVTPMLATTGGSIILLSTPMGIDNYFYRMFHNEKFTRIHVNPDEVIESRPEPQRTSLLEFRKDEKERMTKLQYQQEHLGLFVGGIQRFIDDELIEQLCVIDPAYPDARIGKAYMGIDMARMGGDEIVLCSGDKTPSNTLNQFEMTIPDGQTLTDTARLIIHVDNRINHTKIYMDDGGFGVGVYDMLFEDKRTKKKIVGLNNAKRSIDKLKDQENYRVKKLLGEDMAINFKVLAEQGKIKLFDDPRVRQSLRTMQCDDSDGFLKIYGNYSHIFESLKRLVWCLRGKHLKTFFY